MYHLSGLGQSNLWQGSSDSAYPGPMIDQDGPMNISAPILAQAKIIGTAQAASQVTSGYLVSRTQ